MYNSGNKLSGQREPWNWKSQILTSVMNLNFLIQNHRSAITFPYDFIVSIKFYMPLSITVQHKRGTP